MLCEMLAARGDVGRPGSHFHRPSVASWQRAHGVADAGAPVATLRAVFDAAAKYGRGGSDVFGLRLQRDSAPFFFEQLGLLRPDCDTDLARLSEEFGPLLFIHLWRKDSLGQAISRLRAQQSGL